MGLSLCLSWQCCVLSKRQSENSERAYRGSPWPPHTTAVGSACNELFSPHTRQELEVRISERGSRWQSISLPLKVNVGDVPAGTKRKLQPHVRAHHSLLSGMFPEIKGRFSRQKLRWKHLTMRNLTFLEQFGCTDLYLML